MWCCTSRLPAAMHCLSCNTESPAESGLKQTHSGPSGPDPASMLGGKSVGMRHRRQRARLELGMEAGTVHAIHVLCFVS